MNAPPRQVADQLRQWKGSPPPDRDITEVALARQEDRALSRPSESLPVLDAFREFLEAERQRMRRRTQALAVGFTIVLVFVVAGGLLIIQGNLSRISRDYGAIRTALQENAATVNRRTEAAVLRVGQTAQVTEEAVARVGEAARSLSKDLVRQGEALSDARTSLAAQLGAQSNALQQVQAFFASLQEDNEALRGHLAAIQHDLPSLTNEIESMRIAMSELRSLPPAHDPLAEDTNTAPAAVTSAEPTESMRPAQPVEPVETFAMTAVVERPPGAPSPEADVPTFTEPIDVSYVPPATESLPIVLMRPGSAPPSRWHFLVPGPAAVPPARRDAPAEEDGPTGPLSPTGGSRE